jgi:hypothetical protein
MSKAQVNELKNYIQKQVNPFVERLAKLELRMSPGADDRYQMGNRYLTLVTTVQNNKGCHKFI